APPREPCPARSKPPHQRIPEYAAKPPQRLRTRAPLPRPRPRPRPGPFKRTSAFSAPPREPDAPRLRVSREPRRPRREASAPSQTQVAPGVLLLEPLNEPLRLLPRGGGRGRVHAGGARQGA